MDGQQAYEEVLIPHRYRNANKTMRYHLMSVRME